MKLYILVYLYTLSVLLIFSDKSIPIIASMKLNPTPTLRM